MSDRPSLIKNLSNPGLGENLILLQISFDPWPSGKARAVGTRWATKVVGRYKVINETDTLAIEWPKGS